MIKFPAQVHGFRRTVTGDNYLTLSVDSSFSNDISEIMQKDSNAMFMVYLEDVKPEDNLQEESKTLKEKFTTRLHVLIAEIAEIDGISPLLAKSEIKMQLLDSGEIKSSTKELSIRQLSKLCASLEQTIKEKKHG